MTDNVLSFLDGYCERAGMAGLMAEPANVVSNVAFLIAAWAAWKMWHASGTVSISKGWDIGLLILTLVATFIGSALWHLYAQQWALLADVLPITLFINVYLLSFLVRIAQLRWWWVLALWLVFQVLTVLSEIYLPRNTLNGSIMYAPAYFSLVLMTVYCFRIKHAMATRMLQVLVVFGVSLTFRTIDPTICGMLPVGTHFMWHLLNAWVLYSLLVVLVNGSQHAYEESARGGN